MYRTKRNVRILHDSVLLIHSNIETDGNSRLRVDEMQSWLMLSSFKVRNYIDITKSYKPAPLIKRGYFFNYLQHLISCTFCFISKVSRYDFQRPNGVVQNFLLSCQLSFDTCKMNTMKIVNLVKSIRCRT